MHLNLAVELFGISDVSINIFFVLEFKKFILLSSISVCKLISLNILLLVFNKSPILKSPDLLEVLKLIEN